MRVFADAASSEITDSLYRAAYTWLPYRWRDDRASNGYNTAADVDVTVDGATRRTMSRNLGDSSTGQLATRELEATESTKSVNSEIINGSPSLLTVLN